MKKTIKLTKPLKITGKNYSELSYDDEEIDGNLFMQAEQHRISSGKSPSFSPREFDNSLQLYMGFAAIIAINPDIDWSDLERIKGLDLVKILDIGRNFFTQSEEISQENSSEEPTEITPESTTQV